MSIKTFVRNCFDRGMTVEDTWEAALEKYYPLRIVGWNYVLKLARDYRAQQSVARGGALRLLGSKKGK
jgi:hypothetical protein